jgi:hypothetical protein
VAERGEPFKISNSVGYDNRCKTVKELPHKANTAYIEPAAIGRSGSSLQLLYSLLS